MLKLVLLSPSSYTVLHRGPNLHHQTDSHSSLLSSSSSSSEMEEEHHHRPQLLASSKLVSLQREFA